MSKGEQTYSKCRLKVSRFKEKEGMACQACAELAHEFWELVIGIFRIRCCKRCVREIRRRLSLFLPTKKDEGDEAENAG
jgi:hypothetical protein